MNTVLVLTGRSDITADAVVDELTRRRASLVRYDTKDFPVSSKVAATLSSQGWQGTLSGDHRIELDSISSVWWRRPGEFAIPPDWPDEARAFVASEGRVGVLGVLGSEQLTSQYNAAVAEKRAAQAGMDAIEVTERLTASEAREMVAELGDVGKPLKRADRADLADLYKALDLAVTFDHRERVAEVFMKPTTYVVKVGVRGATHTLTTRLTLTV
jgi:hypothetical protein